MEDIFTPNILHRDVIAYLRTTYKTERPETHFDAAKELIKIIKYSSEVRNFYTWK